MKKFIAIFFIFSFFLLSGFRANAADPSPTPVINLQQQINDLKSKIASRVAQLNLVEKRGIIGTVTEISGTQMTLNDLNGNTRFVDVDELTKFSSPSSKSFGISDINKGTTVGVIGIYNKQSRRLLARVVDQITSQPKFIHGAVNTIDRTNFKINVTTEENRSVDVDIETVTKTYSYSSATDLVKSGFSKVKLDQNIIVVGFPEKGSSAISAARIIYFDEIPPNPKISLEPTSTITPSTGSGLKLTPIVK